MVTAGANPREALHEVQTRLEKAGCPDADFDAAELFRFAVGSDARLCDAQLTQQAAEKLEEICVRRESREPLQYICGSWTFLDFDLYVGLGVLCPRADTEVVAETAAQVLAGVDNPKVLDLCAGTGCLGIGVKRLCPSAEVTCVEKSPEAFAYLAKNAKQALGGGKTVEAIQGDLFTYWQALPDEGLDLIVSNPPYLTAKEMRQLQPEVAKEPAMALEAGEDGLDFYRAVACSYKQALRHGGALVLEIGWQQKATVTALLAQHGWENIECRKDYGGNDRCITAHRP